MKKFNYLLLVVILTTGCATGYYAPHNVNQFGAQTQVVLNQANFRIVRNLEVVIDINNSNLKRADVEKSAYAELLRRANLTGSQALINVVIEEVRRERTNIFLSLFAGGLRKYTQHVAARATIIEFLDANGNPIQSVAIQGTAPRTQKTESDSYNTENVTNQNVIEEKQSDPVNTSIPDNILGKYNKQIKFPDAAFMKACLLLCDVNNDKILTEDEILKVKELDVSNWGIKDMSGIELFVNLKQLYAYGNYFSEIDLSKNKNLKKLKLKSKKLTAIYLGNGAEVNCDVPNLIQPK